jgi:hypothetical protein
MAQAFVGELTYMGLITGKWDLDTCIQFLMLSETTQKKLSGIPKPSKPCSIKKIVTRRIYFLTVVMRKKFTTSINNHEVALSNTARSDPIVTLIVNALNLQLRVIRRAFPSYRKAIIPVEFPSSAQMMNTKMAELKHELLEMLAWYNSNRDILQLGFHVNQNTTPSHASAM